MAEEKLQRKMQGRPEKKPFARMFAVNAEASHGISG